MPQFMSVVDVVKMVLPLEIHGRIEVRAPFYGGFSNTPRDAQSELSARTLADHIERAIETAVQEFENTQLKP